MNNEIELKVLKVENEFNYNKFQFVYDDLMKFNFKLTNSKSFLKNEIFSKYDDKTFYKFSKIVEFFDDELNDENKIYFLNIIGVLNFIISPYKNKIENERALKKLKSFNDGYFYFNQCLNKFVFHNKSLFNEFILDSKNLYEKFLKENISYSQINFNELKIDDYIDRSEYIFDEFDELFDDFQFKQDSSLKELFILLKDDIENEFLKFINQYTSTNYSKNEFLIDLFNFTYDLKK